MTNFPQLMSAQDFIKNFNESLSSSIGINKLYALIREESFPSIKIGGRYYVYVDRVNEWLEQQCTKAGASHE